MPNLKIYVDVQLLADCQPALVAALVPLRAHLCEALKVDIAACQFAILSAVVMPDLPRANVELHIMPQPDRTRAALTDLAGQIQARISAATGTRTAVRITTLDPQGYIALK
ncbi:MAG: hypothetical protein H7317_08135 [Pseudorhodobacter sp.]|nr:hypothetical protein [Pseudorhodobacter sp.]